MNLKSLEKKLSGVLGVAAPIIGDEINFVNIDFSFSAKDIKKILS